MFVCVCMAVTESDVRGCLRAGAGTVDEVSERSGAGTGCGGCLETVRLLVEGGSMLHPTSPSSDCDLSRSA